MENIFGTYIRKKRETLREQDKSFSVRKVAFSLGVQPSYLSKIERGEQPPPTEEKIYRLSEILNEDPDVLMALAGKVSSDLQEVIRKRPQLFAQLIREMKEMPDDALLKIVKEVRDRNW